MKQSYQIVGMTCQGCKEIVQRSLSTVEDVKHVEIDLQNGLGIIDSGNKIPITKLESALSGTLYKILESTKESGYNDKDLSERFRKLVADYVIAIGQFDYEKLRSCLHTDFEFDGGLKTNSANDFINMLHEHAASGQAGILKNEILAIFIDGKEAWVIYDMYTSKPVPPVTFFEEIILEGEKLKATKLRFERPKMQQLMEAIQKEKNSSIQN